MDDASRIAALERKIRLLEGTLEQANRIRERWHDATGKLQKAQRQLQGSEQRNRLLLNHAFDAILLVDEGFRVLYANPATGILLGMGADQVVGTPVTNWLPDCSTMKPYEINESVWHRDDGQEIPVELVIGPTEPEDSDGQPVMVLTVHDISAHKRVEEALRLYSETLEQRVAEQSANLHRLSQALEQTGEAVFMLGSHGRIEYVNKALCSMSGREASELLDEGPELLLKKSSLPGETETRNKIWHGRLLLLRKDGGQLPVHVSITSIAETTSPQERHAVVIMQDISQREKLEQRLRAAEKLQAVGMLTGGIAHEFNNILACIHGYAYIAATDEHLDEKVRKAVGVIQEQSNKASELIQHMLLFSGQGSFYVQREEVNFSEVVRQVCAEFGQRAENSSRLEFDVGVPDVVLQGDAERLRQMVRVLLENAEFARREADENPCITVQLEVVDIDQDSQIRHGLPDGKAAHLSVRDNGVGMSDEVKAQAFEPFFTTRKVGEGTGLGLSVAWGVVNVHDGVIEVVSQPDKGTEIHIYLPLKS